MAPPSAREKSILVHVSRFPHATTDSLQADAWLIIKHTADGPKLFNIFDKVQPEICLAQTGCALIGSSLYVIGGSNGSEVSNCIHRLNTLNPADGWKICNPMPRSCFRPHVVVSGNLMYLFPFEEIWFDSESRCVWGFIYDTIEQKCWPIEPPPNHSLEHAGMKRKDARIFSPLKMPAYEFCAALKDGRVLVPYFGDYELYLHNPDKNSWELSSDYDPFPVDTYSMPHAVLDGIVYLFDFYSRPTYLHTYDIHNGRLSLILLPGFEFLSRANWVFLVPIGDSKLGLLWGFHNVDTELVTMYYNIIKVSLDPPSATILEKSSFQNLLFGNVLHCLPFDSHPDLTNETLISTSNETSKGDSYISEEILSSTSNETSKEGNMLLNYDNLFEEYLRLCKENLWLLGKVRRTPIVSQQKTNLLTDKILCPSYELSLPSSSPIAGASSIITSGWQYPSIATIVSSLKESCSRWSQYEQYLAPGSRFLWKCIKK